MYLLSIIIATRNSALYIRETLSEVTKSIEKYSHEAEIIVVNDGSDDAVKSQVLAFKEEFQKLTYVSLIKPSGQQLAIKSGIQLAKGQYLVTFDDDLQYKAEDIPKLLDFIRNHPNLKIVCGYSPRKQHRGAYSNISTFTVNILEHLFFRKYRNAHYFTSFKIFNREALEFAGGMKNVYFFWDFNPFEMGFIEVNHHQRTRGVTGYNIFSYLKFFRHIILKMFLKALFAVVLIWTIIGGILLSASQVLTGYLICLIPGIIACCFLSWLKNQKAVIKEVIS